MTAIEWLEEQLIGKNGINVLKNTFEQAKKRERQDIENKAIHFAEWLTDKHTLTLISLYEQFEEQYYTDERRS